MPPSEPPRRVLLAATVLALGAMALAPFAATAIGDAGGRDAHAAAPSASAGTEPADAEASGWIEVTVGGEPADESLATIADAADRVVRGRVVEIRDGVIVPGDHATWQVFAIETTAGERIDVYRLATRASGAGRTEVASDAGVRVGDDAVWALTDAAPVAAVGGMSLATDQSFFPADPLAAACAGPTGAQAEACDLGPEATLRLLLDAQP